jgi:putative tricarboxylic transport membrane protein
MIRSSELWGGLFWFALGTYVVWAGLRLGLGAVNDPGPGFVLFGLGLLTMALAASICLGALRDPGEPLAALWRDTRWQKVLLVVALLVAYGLAFDTVGFIIASTVLLLVLMLFIDPVRLIVAIPVALLTPPFIWYVITRYLKIQIPTGLLSGVLG